MGKHLAVSTEAVSTHRQQAVGSADPHGHIALNHCLVADVVICALIFHQTGIGDPSAVLIVISCAVLLHQTGIDDHLTLCVEAVGTLGQQTVGLIDIECLVGDGDRTGIDVVIAAIHQHHAYIVLASAIGIVIQNSVFFLQSGSHNDLAVSAKSVSTRRQHAVGGAGPAALVQNCCIIIIEVIVIAVDAVEAIVIGAVIHNIVKITVEPMQAVGCVADQSTGFVKFVPNGLDGVGRTGGIYAGSSIVLFEVVLLAVNGLPALIVVVRAVEILQTHTVIVPVAL